MKIEEIKTGDEVWIKGIVADVSYNIHGEKMFDVRTTSFETPSGFIHKDYVKTVIDQPKPAVSQCVIDWVDDSRERDYEFDEWFDPDNQPLEVYKWLNCKNKRQADINALALVTLIVNGPDAVTVEKKKLYQIIDKRLNATFSCLGYDIEGRAWFWGNKKFFKKNKGDRLAHTRQQLIDAGFEEVFENPNYEVEEVTV